MADENINIIVKLKDMASSGLDKMKLGLNNMGKSANDAADKAKSLQTRMEGVGKVGKSLAVGFGAVAGVLGLIGKAAIKASSDWETMRTSFTTMLGSAEKADFLLNQIKQTAETTPFTLSGLAESSKTLLAFGANAKDIIPTMRMLGDISGGNGEKLQSLTLAFGQMSSAGRLMGQDLLQMINVGFNPLNELSKMTGKSMAELKKEMEAGAISTEMVKAAFEHATSAGGMFYDGMNKQSQTLAGRWSTLQDGIDGVMRAIGERLMPVAKSVVEFFINLIDKFNAMPESMKTFIVVTGAVVAGISALLAILGTALAILPAVSAGLAVVGLSLSAVIWPITATVAGIALLVAGFVTLKKAVNDFGGIGNVVKNIYLSWFQLMLGGFQNILKAAKKFIDLLNKMPGVNIPIDDAIAGIDKLQEKLEEHKAKRIEDDAQEVEDVRTNEAAKSQIRLDQNTVDKEMKAIEDEAKKEKDAQDLEEFRAKVMAMSEIEPQQAGYTAQQIAAIKTLQEKKKNETLKAASKEYINFIGQAAEEEKDIAKAVAKGSLEFIKDGLKKQILAKAAELVEIGTAIIIATLGAAPEGWSHLVGGATLAAGGVAAINSIQLAEGGIVQPQPGGVSATIAEAGSAEAVIPLDSDEARGMLGGGNVTVNISGKPLAKELYEIQQEMIRTGELSA